MTFSTENLNSQLHLSKRCDYIYNGIGKCCNVTYTFPLSVSIDERFFLSREEKEIRKDLGDTSFEFPFSGRFVLHTFKLMNRYFWSDEGRRGSRLYDKRNYGVGLDGHDLEIEERFSNMFEYRLCFTSHYSEFLDRFLEWEGYNIRVEDILKGKEYEHGLEEKVETKD